MPYTKGFDRTTDPLDGMGFGYRSHELKSPFPLSDAQLDVINLSYNGFTFPSTAKVNATWVPEQDSSGRTTKYSTLAITVECFITQYDTARPGISEPSLDGTMDEIRYRLSQPCQPLRATVLGLGTVLINYLQTSTNPLLSTSASRYFDVDFGPKPQVLDWRPAGGGLTAQVQWLITARITPCNNTQNQQFGILEHSYGIKWKVDDAGFLSRTVSGKMEMALTRYPSHQANEASNQLQMGSILTNFQTNYEYVAAFIPGLKGFLREQDFDLSPNKKQLVYTIVDTEIRSPEAYPEGIIKMDMKERLRSTLQPDGLLSWQWSFTGHLEAGLPKKLGQSIVRSKRFGLQAFYLVLQDRLDRVGRLNYATSRPPIEGGASLEDVQTQKIFYLPTLIDISNDIFGNGFDVNVGYQLVCPRNLLFQATGFFDRVRSANFSWDKWNKYLQNNNVTSSPMTQRQIVPAYDYIVDLCHPLVSQSNNSSSQENTAEIPFTETPFSQKRPEPENSWLKWKNSFIVQDESHTTIGTILSKDVVPIQEVNNTNQIRGKGKLNLAQEYQTEIGEPQVSRAAKRTVFITMIGGAERLGYEINAPNVLTVDGTTVNKWGKDVIVPDERNSGILDETGKPIKIHTLKWRKTYILTAKPTNWIIRSTGYPGTVGQ